MGERARVFRSSDINLLGVSVAATRRGSEMRLVIRIRSALVTSKSSLASLTDRMPSSPQCCTSVSADVRMMLAACRVTCRDTIVTSMPSNIA